MVNEVIIDTNALMLPFQSKLRIEEELERLLGKCEILVPSSIIEEIKKLAMSNPKAMAALRYSKKFKVVETEMKGDDSIIDLALKRKSFVLTNDKILIERLRDLGIRVIRPRGERRLEFA